MKKIIEAIENLDFGNKIIIEKEQMRNEEEHSSCLLKYDGKVFVEAIGIDLGNFLDAIPMIREQLNQGHFYQISYLRETKEYQSSIMKFKKENQEEYTNEIVNNLSTNSSNFEAGMFELEEKIAASITSNKKLQKRKIA